MTKIRNALLAAVFLTLLSGCQGAMDLFNQIQQTQADLQAAAGVETVSFNVQNSHMAISALDAKFKEMSDEDKKKMAKDLATIALADWPSKWPITEVVIYLGYSDDEGGNTSNFKFKPSDLKGEVPVSAKPTPTE